MSQKVVVIYSGGMDSFTVLHKALQEGKDVLALSFNYGQRHVKELDVAANVCKKHNIPHKIVDITAMNDLMSGSSLTDDIDIPESEYDEASMKSTVVPNRNMILLSLAIGYAVSNDAGAVYYGAHSGDHDIYPDCRPEFVRQMDVVSKLANYEPVAVHAPYLEVDKNAILTDGLAMGLDYSNTWTCYNGRDKACGKCGACQERLAAFAANGIDDPVAYEN